ncbi:hypothetical protein RFM23_05470 [Mesorhizobium abyssinicae]|uniref:Tail fiber protein n=1 Tax=Mesorhizobium abyssinicae TaxID=1209958 RepID=A0ABU5AIG5_9HYPH|nr:hypothetical protein [Mesorhizobium abyssinicae]MDX8537072.1 hypothetical protein [Mesorhizobium abyssinicae]
MTVPSDINRSGPYSGNGVTTVFDYEFKITNENYIKVIKADAAGVETVLTIDADYIVSDVGNPAGGQVALTVPLPTGQTLTMIPSVPFTQEIDLENQGAYYAQTVEDALDLSVMRDQQLQEQVNRAVLIPPSEDPEQLDGLVHDILRLADSADNIDIVAGSVASVTTVAANIASVNTAAANIAAIIAAPAEAAAAAASAVAAAASAASVAAAVALIATALQPADIGTAVQAYDADLASIASLTTQPFGRSLLTSAAAADLRQSGVVPTYTTLALVPGLDTAKDKLAYVTDFGQEGWFKWDGTDLSTRTVIQSLTTTTVVAATDICTKVAHLLSTGAGVVVTTAVNGLAVNTVYYAIVIDADTFKLATSPTNAIAGTAIDLTGSTNFTLKQLRDPLQRVYVIKTGGQLDGTAGAWVKAQGAQDLGISTANYHRFNDRILLGLGATGWMGDTPGMGASGAGSWLGDEIGAGSAFAMSYLLVGSQLASVTNPVAGFSPGAIVGATRTRDGADSGTGYWGLAGFASGHATSGGSVIWGAYLEAVKRPGSNTTIQGLEVEATNLNSTPVNPVVSPEATYVQGRSFGIFLASGGSNAAPYDVDSAIFVGKNGARFRTGLTFYRDALTKDGGTNYQHAVLLADKALVEWYTSDLAATVGFSIHSEVSAVASQMRLIASDIGLLVNNASGGLAMRVIPNGGVTANYLTLQAVNAGSSPILLAAGSDTNVGHIIRGKGTGGGALQDGASTVRLSWNTTGLGFFAAAPVSQRTMAAATGTATRTTFDTATVTLPLLAERVKALIDDFRSLGTHA